MVSVHWVELLSIVVELAGAPLEAFVWLHHQAMVGFIVLNLVSFLDVLDLVRFVGSLEGLDDGVVTLV